MADLPNPVTAWEKVGTFRGVCRRDFARAYERGAFRLRLFRAVSETCDMLRTHIEDAARPAGMTPDRIRKRYLIVTGLIIGLKVVDITRQIGGSRS